MTVSYNSKRKVAKTKKRLGMMTVEEYKMLKPEELKGHKKIIDFMKDNDVKPRLAPNKVKDKDVYNNIITGLKEAIEIEKVDSMKQYKKFEVTFTIKSKYNPITRIVEILGFNEYHVTMLVHRTFGSFKSVKPALVPSDRIKIESCIEAKGDLADQKLVEVGGEK